MPEKRMLIVDSDVVKKIDENRGDMTVSDFITFLIDSQLRKSAGEPGGDHITKEEFHQFEQGIKDLLRNFLEFFLSYGLELGKQPTDREIDKLSQKFQTLGFGTKDKSR